MVNSNSRNSHLVVNVPRVANRLNALRPLVVAQEKAALRTHHDKRTQIRPGRAAVVRVVGLTNFAAVRCTCAKERR
jgi:hypothetical protein